MRSVHPPGQALGPTESACDARGPCAGVPKRAVLLSLSLLQPSRTFSYKPVQYCTCGPPMHTAAAPHTRRAPSLRRKSSLALEPEGLKRARRPHTTRARACARMRTHHHRTAARQGRRRRQAHNGDHGDHTTITHPPSRQPASCLLGAAVAAIGTSDTSAIWNDDNHSIRLRCRLPVRARACPPTADDRHRPQPWLVAPEAVAAA